MNGETPSLTMHRAPHRLDLLARECLERAAPDLAARGLSVTHQIGSGMPALDVDGALVGEAIACLVAEAIRLAAPAARLRLTVKAGRTNVMVAVKSPGAGLGDAQRRILFTGEARPGSLARASAIVAAHGGVAWANGRQGRGITFYMTLPIRPSGPRGGGVAV